MDCGLSSYISSSLVKKKDDLIFKALERFGITRDNFIKHKDRITVYTWTDVNAGVTYDRYTLDSKPIFNITSWPEMEMDEENMSYKAIFKTKIEFFEEVEK